MCDCKNKECIHEVVEYCECCGKVKCEDCGKVWEEVKEVTEFWYVPRPTFYTDAFGTRYIHDWIEDGTTTCACK